MNTPADPRLIAFYLPQFHPIPENDEWWGKGFTEWTNVAKAKPMFPGHYQPRLPADLGFYDLRVAETRHAQAEMAKKFGIEAFCYYHYWFGGKRLLERPLQEIIASGEPDLGICLCWANQTWTGIWHGAPNRILIEQTYPGEEDHRAHFDALLPVFSDKRYVRVDGLPLFVIYQPMDFPDTLAVTKLWRKMARDAGLGGLHLVGVNGRKDWQPEAHGYDAVIAPRLPAKRGFVSKRHVLKWVRSNYEAFRRLPTIYRYKDVMDSLLAPPRAGVVDYPCVIPNWDNTPRSGQNGLVLTDSSPELFREHFQKAMALAMSLPSDRRLLFIKSWNEWAEGNYLEPDQRYGYQYLETILDELRKTNVG